MVGIIVGTIAGLCIHKVGIFIFDPIRKKEFDDGYLVGMVSTLAIAAIIALL